MYKILHNNQIIDVLKDLCYIKCLPKTQRIIATDSRQANGIVSSDGDQIYHIYGTKNTFNDKKLSVYIIPIEEEEYLKLTTQLKENQSLENQIRELKATVEKLQALIMQGS